MRKYAQIGPQFWSTSKTGRAIRKKGAEAIVVAMYLMSSPHSNMLGLYYQPMLYMAHETGLGIEGAEKGLRWCIEAGFCSFDEPSEMVWVHEMALYQIGEALAATDKRCVGVQKEYDALPDCPFLSAFFDRYQAVFHMKRKRGGAEGEGSPKVAPWVPLGSQEQEQSPEQEQDFDDDDPGASAHAGAREGVGAHAGGEAPPDPAWSGDPLDDPTVPQRRGEWAALFSERGHDLDIESDRAFGCMKAWKKGGVTAGEMRRALLQAEKKSAGPVGCWSAYVDAVLTDQRVAAQQAADKPPMPPARGAASQGTQGSAVPTYEESQRAAAADAATKLPPEESAERARRVLAELEAKGLKPPRRQPAPAEERSQA